MLQTLRELHTSDTKRFTDAFPRLKDPRKFVITDTFDEDVSLGATLPHIKAKVEARLKKFRVGVQV
jgi:hypothetical protein